MNETVNEELLKERYVLALTRIREIKKEHEVGEAYRDYFCFLADFILRMDQEYQFVESGALYQASLEELLQNNRELYQDILPNHYEESYAEPGYAVRRLSDGYGQLLSFLYVELRSLIVFAYEKNRYEMTIRMELLLEIYQCFVCAFQETKDVPKYEELQQIVYWFVSDYYETEAERIVSELLLPEYDFVRSVVMERDLNDLRYLFYFGEYVSENELETAKHLNSLKEEQIQLMADTFTEGFRIGFQVYRKDIHRKKTVNVRYRLGFERMVKQAVKNFKGLSLETVIYRGDYDIFHGYHVNKTGFHGSIPNMQLAYDHKDDQALFVDSKLLNRKFEVFRSAYQNAKEAASVFAGPALIVPFGETPFEPKSKKEAVTLSKKQQKQLVEHVSARAQMQSEFISGEETSYTIIAFPVPSIGENFREIFDEIVRINTLDYARYSRLQQTIIDALDKADYVMIKGKGDNRTDLKVKLHKLMNPEKETNFENCVADVNIPVGEVFTSPQLAGTEGVLHVTKVFLGEMEFKNLMLRFADGKIIDYDCSNFDTEEENKKLIKEMILNNHDTLPMGEFAIGTNTVAYVAAKKYGIERVLPILIAEKMGPHFAVGDTCYRQEEELHLYNPNGKEIIAKENEVSALRKTDFASAYFNCHTDITIPYDELHALFAVTSQKEEIPIIKNGRFVLEGCEELNVPLDES